MASERLRDRKVADMLEGVRFPETELRYVDHVISVYGFMTMAQLQKLVAETYGGEAGDCGSIHEYTNRPTTECVKHFRSNRCNHQLEISSQHVTAGGIYYASAAALDSLPHPVADRLGEPVTRKRIVGNVVALHGIDPQVRRAYVPLRYPNAPEPPGGIQLPAPLQGLGTVGEVAKAVNRMKDPYGDDLDLIMEALGAAFAELLGPLLREEPLP